MGFDSFGLNAENAAIRDNAHPATFTYANIATSTESCKKFGVSFDWTRTFNTSDPEYYRWTQWLFLKFRERGLAYRKNSPVNWCPFDQTVLANEQVDRRPLRALRHRGHQARADAVVLQDHRVRPGAAGRPGRPGADLARAGDQRAAQLDRPVRGRPRHLPPVEGRRRADRRSTPPAPTRCSARRSWWSRPTPRWPASWSPTSSDRRTTPTWRRCARPATSSGCRPTARRPASSWASTRSTR